MSDDRLEHWRPPDRNGARTPFVTPVDAQERSVWTRRPSVQLGDVFKPIIETEALQKLLRVSMLTALLANALRMSVNPEKPPTWAVFIQETLKRAEKEGI